MKYIALLRGINVGGHKLIKMEALRKSLERLPFTNVSTYIQSGNILFESLNDRIPELQQAIGELIKTDFGFDVPIVIVTLDELNEVVANNPYSSRVLTDPAQPYVSFLSEIPSSTALESLKGMDFDNDEFCAYKKWLYILYDSVAKSKLNNVLIERKLNMTSTARNWKTVHKLIELSQE